MRNRALLAAGAVTLLAVTACGGTSSGSSAGASGSGSASGTCPNGPVTLTLLRAQQNPPKDEYIQQYEAANPCVKVTAQEVPFDQLATKTQLSGGQSGGPDVMEVDSPNIQTFASAGLLLPLDGYLPQGYADDAVAASRAEFTYQDKTYSVGMAQVSAGLFYNKTMLDKLGIKPPSTLATAWTWDQAIEAMKKCQQGSADNPKVFGLAPSAFGNGTAGNTYRDMMIIRSAGDPKAPEGSSAYNTFYGISKDGKTVAGYLDTPEAIAGATLYQSMYQGPDKITSAEGLTNAFIDGKACFDLQTSYLAGNLASSKPDFSWGITPVPYIKTPIVHTGDVTLAVSANTKHPDEAAKFAIALGIGKQGLDWVAANKSFPSIKSPLSTSQFEYLKQPPLSILSDELVQWGQPRPPSTHFVQYDTLVSAGLRDIAQGANVQQTLQATTAKVDSALAR